MSIFNLVNNWRKLLREEESTPIGSIEYLKQTGKKGTPEYEKLVKAAEKAAEKTTEKPEPKKEKVSPTPDPTCKIKTTCKCVAGSETSLSIKDIQAILNKYISTTSGTAIKVDGKCSLETQKAIMKFQSDTKIECDGCVGDETHGKMKELKLTDIPSLVTVDHGENSPSVAGGDTSNITKFTASPGSAGNCISIKADGNKPYGHKTDRKAGLVNGVDFYSLLKTRDLQPRGRTKYMWGNPILLKALNDAAAAVGKNFPDLSGKGYATLWSASGKNGGPKLANASTGRYHNSHQTGLDADVGFFVTTTKANYLATYSKAARKKQKSAGKSLQNLPISQRFDMPRNVCFLDHLVRNPAVKLVFIDNPIIGAMIRWIKKNDTDQKYTKLLAELVAKGGKVYEPGMFGHHNHYHVRCHFPPGSPTMSQWKKMSKAERSAAIGSNNQTGPAPNRGPAGIKQSAASTAGPETIAAVKARIKNIRASRGNLGSKIKSMMAEMSKLSLDDLKSIYGGGFGYALGLVNKSEPSITYNHNKQFYGASSPKTMAALAQMVKYDGTGQALNRKELDALLAYLKGSSGSNRTNRAISMTHKRRYRSGGTKGKYVPYKRQGGTQLGAVDREDVKRVAQVFGITNDRFLWGGSNNQQSPRDMFKFFGGLQRMITGTGSSLENNFYKRYKTAVDAVVSSQKRRSHSPNVRFSGIKNRNHWGKGGRYGGNVSHTFVVDGKYVLSAYVYLGRNTWPNDFEEYAVLNTIISKLLEKMR